VLLVEERESMEESDLAEHVIDLTFLLTSGASLLDTTTYLLLSL